jgi:hypothetical protein
MSIKPLALFLLLSTVTLSQNIVNDTLYVYGEDIQKAELSNRETSQRIQLLTLMGIINNILR